MVTVDYEKFKATINEPPLAGDMTDDEWILVLMAASEVHKELSRLGYEVQG